MPFKQLIETVSKKPVPPHHKNAVVEVMAADENDEDVEVSVLLALPLVANVLILLWQVPFLLVGLE
jgi:hypothetical protein